MKSKEKKENPVKLSDKEVSLAPLTFEDALSAILQVKSVDNKEVVAPKKKQRKPPKK